MKRQRQEMKTGFLSISYLLIVLMIAVLTACGGGGGGDGGSSSSNNNPNPTPTPTTGTISGSVSGTIIVAVNDNGVIVASDDTTGKTPDPNTGNYPFTLTGIPTGVNIRVYLITSTGVYPMYFDSDNNTTPDTNVFSLTSAATISLGFVDTSTGQAIPANDPTDTAGVSAGTENANIPPLNTASGTYTYNSGALTITATNPAFVCGEEWFTVGTYNIPVTTLISTTMVWDLGGGDVVTWTRPSGTDGDILGTWSLNYGNIGSPWDITFLLTFNSDGTFTYVFNYKCIYTGSLHTTQFQGIDNYYAWFYVNDPTQQYTSVTVAGPSISGSLSLTYSNGSWYYSNGSPFSFGSTPPTPPLTYTYTFVSNAGTTTLTDYIEAFVPLATNLSPLGTGVSATPTFSWTGGGSGYSYMVFVSDPNCTSICNNLWESGFLTTTSVVYAGLPLTSGATYNYWVAMYDTYGNVSWATESFVVQ